MVTKSKLFRVFVEGQTISDGRVIDAAWIDQIVETFNTDTYTPRINVEHLSGYSPEPPFNGYGQVVHVEAKTDEISIAGKGEKRRALYAQVEGNDQLVALVAANQKPFPSVELCESYAGCGKVGLIGLALTDKPASVGTQALQFSRSMPGSLFARGADPVTLEFEAAPTSVADAIKAGFASVAGMFGLTEPGKPKDEPKKAANDNFDPAAFATALGDTLATSLATALAPVTAAHDTLKADVAALKTSLERTEQPGFSRPLTSGAAVDAKYATDC